MKLNGTFQLGKCSKRETAVHCANDDKPSISQICTEVIHFVGTPKGVYSIKSSCRKIDAPPT